MQDGAGRFVTGLNEGDFRVYEDGVEQKIAVFEKEDVDSAIGILLDNSLSMVDILPMMKTGSAGLRGTHFQVSTNFL